jgi:broad specificity phosphatase PhoE
MAIFYICRHGETENNKNHKLSGWIDTPLTDLGQQQALSAARKLKVVHIDKIISSDLGRAFITAYLIAKNIDYKDLIERNNNLREVNYGDLANQPYKNYPNLTPQENSNFIPNNGESLNQMQQRVLQYLEKLNRQYPDQSILLIAHDGTINAIRANFLGQEMGIADLTHNAHDFIASFQIENNKIINLGKI